uniref:Uncharacterized protein n=1 Tax=Vitis vinifera TaxID=29760 RepID=A5BVN3_VITVI|nr:hypothetical protein VITISV_019568 [Vitis vinifera]
MVLHIPTTTSKSPNPKLSPKSQSQLMSIIVDGRWNWRKNLKFSPGVDDDESPSTSIEAPTVTVCKRPGTVILFDEIENVHLAVIYKDPQEVSPILKWIQETPTLPISGMTLSTDGANSTYRIDSINQSILGEKLLDKTVVEKSSNILVP